MRLSSAAAVGVLLGLALIVSACDKEHTASIGQKTPPSGPEARTATVKRVCPAQLHELLDSMDSLRGKLVGGLSYPAYLHEVHRVEDVYDDIHADRLPLVCLTATGAPAERALNRYIDAANTWGDCLAEASCELESVEPKLRRKWALASDLLSSAQNGLPGGGRF